jgi:hypothetical protein
MKLILNLLGIIAVCLLASCTSETRRHMRLADSLLLQSEEKMAGGEMTLALAFAEQAGAEVQQGVAARPVRKGAGGEPLDLNPLLEAWISGPHRELLDALKGNQPGPAAAAFAATRQQCVNCHTAIGRLTIPVSGLSR